MSESLPGAPARKDESEHARASAESAEPLAHSPLSCPCSRSAWPGWSHFFILMPGTETAPAYDLPYPDMAICAAHRRVCGSVPHQAFCFATIFFRPSASYGTRACTCSVHHNLGRISPLNRRRTADAVAPAFFGKKRTSLTGDRQIHQLFSRLDLSFFLRQMRKQRRSDTRYVVRCGFAEPCLGMNIDPSLGPFR